MVAPAGKVDTSVAPDRSASGAFVPDANAVVIAEPVRIFLGNLPFKITDELIHECFGEFGTIEGIHWVTDKATGQFYGTASVDTAYTVSLSLSLALSLLSLLLHAACAFLLMNIKS